MTNRSPDSAVPFDEDRPWRMKPKVFFAIVGVICAATLSWAAIKSDVNSIHRDIGDHTQSLSKIQAQLSAVEADARAARELASSNAYKQDLVNREVLLRLDYMTGANRGPRPGAAGQP